MQLTIKAIHEEAPGVKTFVLDDTALHYGPGQFLTFSFGPAAREQRRSYSLSSSPGIDSYPSITLKRVPNGLASRWLIDAARVGDTLQATGQPTGLFTLPDSLSYYEAVWLFAAGIGITPVYALLKTLLLHTAMSRVVLLYSNHSKEHTVFYEELESLRNQHPERFRLSHLWSNTRDMRRARISKESFPLFRKEWMTDNPERVLCYLCGPESYMWLLQLLLQDIGVPPVSVRREAFLVKKEVPHRMPVDKEPHRITVSLAGTEASFINAYPDSILKSAKAAGIHLPYSCETGQCGSCTAICMKGKVWMSYDEVLTERDIAAGRILTCTGHAIDGDVVLAFQE